MEYSGIKQRMRLSAAERNTAEYNGINSACSKYNAIQWSGVKKNTMEEYSK